MANFGTVLGRWKSQVVRRLLPGPLRELIKLCLPPILRREGRARFRAALNRRLGSSQAAASLLPPGWTLDDLAGRYLRLHAMSEDSRDEVLAKARAYRDLAAETKLDRVRLLRVMARLLDLAGVQETAALYRLRAIRLMGRDVYGDLPVVIGALEDRGYRLEARAIAAMYGDPAERIDACRRFLEERHAACRAPIAETPFTATWDSRGNGRPRVSVILTVYAAADKLPTFLRALQMQTLNRRSEMELIVVDSCSPRDELAPLRSTELVYPIPTLYVRTPERETIQTAWNRAIGLARAPYLCLLGVDEAMTPEAFADLAGRLDDNPSLDWVQGDCRVMRVDPHGLLIEDVLTYDRSGYAPELVYLDSCYLGPVGAVYRKSIHDRVGWFDGSFRGAGDTEFKMRMLPRIRTAHVPRMFGIFLNYPEERVTGSPRAEFEDYRAWHLHRSPGGLRHACGEERESLERLLVRGLGYRKTWQSRWSTDFDVAESVCELLGGTHPLTDDVRSLAAAARSFDRLDSVHPSNAARQLAAAMSDFHKAGGRCRHYLGRDEPIEPFHDDRHEHHHWFW